MRAPSRTGGWILLLTALLIIAAWSPDGDRALLVKAVNWAADPGDRLPVLPAQLGFGLSDDLAAVEARDDMVRRYDDLYAEGGLTRARLRLKVARDPFNPATERQLLLAGGAVVLFAVLRSRR